MKSILILAAAVCLVFSGCKKLEKNIHDYHPKVKTVSAKVLADGSVKLTGSLLSEGVTDLWGAGFCMDTIPHPEMDINQRVCDTFFGREFYTVYSSLDATRKYYFKAWAANEYGYTYGEEILVDNITIDSSLIPCQPNENTINATNFFPEEQPILDISPIDIFSHRWQIDLYSGSIRLRLSFGKQPTTGKYSIVDNDGSGHKVQILYTGPLTSGNYLQSGNVYVKQISQQEIEVIVCDALLSVVSGEYIISAKFRAFYE